MKLDELQALVIKQGEYLQAAEKAIAALEEGRRIDNEAHMHLVQRADNIVEGFKAELVKRDERIELLQVMMDTRYEEIVAVSVRLDDIGAKVEGRNKSAPVKRNMTDSDAMRVLQGDLTEVNHKDAAEKMGLTYAQVYSCRLGFTFKHVIRDLEKAGWINRWAKG